MKYFIFLFLFLSNCSGEQLLTEGPAIDAIWNGRYQQLVGIGNVLMEVGTKQIRIETIENIVMPGLYDLDSIISQTPNLVIWVRNSENQYIPIKFSRINIQDNATTISISKPQTTKEQFPTIFNTNIPTERFF